MIAGDTEFGVRLVSILLALPMSCAVFRTASILFGGWRVAATATILLNVTLMAAVGTLIVTPDAPLLVASSFVLFFLAKVLETGRGAWWLAVGAAVGAALLSKYTAHVFRPGDPDLAGRRPKTAALADLALALSRRPGCAGAVFAGHSLERRSPLGLLHQADRPRPDRGFQAGLHRRIDPDPDRVRNAAGVHPRRDGALRAAQAQCRRVGRARADQRDVLDHRCVFHLAFAARPRRGQLVRAGLSGIRDRGRRCRQHRRDGKRASSASSISARAGLRRSAS